MECLVLQFSDGQWPEELHDLQGLAYPEWIEERQDAERRQREEQQRQRDAAQQARSASGPPPKARPTSRAPATVAKEWVRVPLGHTATFYSKVANDYFGTSVRCDLLRNGENFVAFNREGVAANGDSVKHKVWFQYLRRVTHYASLVFGTVPNIALKDLDDADNEAWLRLYTHNFNVTCLKHSNSFLTPEAMMIRLDMCDMPSTSKEIPALVKSLQSRIGTYIIEKPLVPDADQELCGIVRAALAVIITDLVYHTRSSTSKSTHNLESALQNVMGNPCVKVFQTAWETLRDAESTLEAFDQGLQHVKSATSSGANPYVVVWLCFTAMVREGTHIISEESSFLENIVNYISDIQTYVGSPVFVLLNSDAQFHGSKGDLQKPAWKMYEELSSRGILCSMNGMMWRGVYSLAGDSMYRYITKHDRDATWAHLDKHLLRQKILMAWIGELSQSSMIWLPTPTRMVSISTW